MIDFSISKAMFELFPKLNVFAFQAGGVQGVIPALDARTLLTEAIQEVKALYSDTKTLSHSPIISEWRSAYRVLGVKPSAFRSSIEALIRRAIADKPIDNGIPLVNFYNAGALHYQACIGAYDAEKVHNGHIALRLCDPDRDSFTPLGGKPSEFPLTQKLAVYALRNEILCWGLNCRDSRTSCLDKHTDVVLFFAGSVTFGQKARARHALETLSQKLTNVGATVSQLKAANVEQPYFQF
ncbi:MAG TPA: phenylalanine--tRNA ligase beta subunit-related protein [Gammaproteobacteria bacterium]|nr:phenylalanine--tRNA ligase beta subunit-related protein [Gammaproteobacteria bacterium]